MIPRALPKLMTDAARNGWDVHVEHDLAGVDARFARGHTLVNLGWIVWADETRLDVAEINGSPTPYTQCTRLIRAEETP